MTTLDLLAIAAHPDDVELTCGGTLLRAAGQGYKTGILDLTAGEMGTRGTPEIRAPIQTYNLPASTSWRSPALFASFARARSFFPTGKLGIPITTTPPLLVTKDASSPASKRFPSKGNPIAPSKFFTALLLKAWRPVLSWTSPSSTKRAAALSSHTALNSGRQRVNGSNASISQSTNSTPEWIFSPGATAI